MTKIFCLWRSWGPSHIPLGDGTITCQLVAAIQQEGPIWMYFSKISQPVALQTWTFVSSETFYTPCVSVCVWTEALPVILHETLSCTYRFPHHPHHLLFSHKRCLHFLFSSAPAAQTAIVHEVASLQTDPEASLHSQSHHSTPSQKAATALFCAAVLANTPHVLGMAEMGAACRETLNCLSRSMRTGFC